MLKPPILAHLDLDAFFAAVEELENPELRRKPLVVGGDPRGRGVVATANYVARQFGIHSAMSCAEALRRCPHAVFVRPRHRTYSDYSKEVWSTVRQVVPTVERTGLDEGYLDVGEVAADFNEARAVAEAVQTAVRGATSLTCSLGVATTKVVAKVASDRRKPGGLVVVLPGREAAFLAPFEIRLLPGVGPRSEARLRAVGIETIGALAGLSDERLRQLLPGKVGTSSATALAGSIRAGSSSRHNGSRSATKRPSSGTSPTWSSCGTSSAGCPHRWLSTCAARARRHAP